MQERVARECEAATGPAVREAEPAAASAAPDEELDPLDAFMAEMKELESTAPAAKPRGKAGRIEEADPAADFMEVGGRGSGWGDSACWRAAFR